MTKNSLQGATASNNLSCPGCGLSQIKRNGHTHYGKQNDQCKKCGRQFVEDSQHSSEAQRDLIKHLLLERPSLLGICRVMKVSLRWLLTFIGDLYEALPDDLNIELPRKVVGPVRLLRLEAQADEMWSFVKRKENKQWVWMALDVETRQVIAFYGGDRSRKSARKLWNRLPGEYREQVEDFVGYVLPQLARRDVRLAIENHFDVPARTLAAVVNRHATERLGFCLDSANSLRSFEPPAYVLEHLRARAFCCHVKDYKVHGTQFGFRVAGAPLGAGDLPLDDFLDAVVDGAQAPQLFIENWVVSQGSRAADVAEDWRWLCASTEVLRARLAARQVSS